MRNQEIAKAIQLIGEGFLALSKAFEESEAPVILGVDFAKGNDKTVETVQEVKQEPVKEVAEEKVEEAPIKEEAPTTAYTEEELNAMSYNEIKALAKEYGLKAVGSKKVIIDNILAHLTEDSVEASNDVEDEIVEEPPVEPVQDEYEDDEEDTVEPDEDELNLYDTIVADLEGYTDEELADILSSIGVSPKGKRQALLAKIVQAVEEGKLEWDDSESEDLVEDEKEPVVEENDEVEANETFIGTEARRIACEEECERIETSIEKEELSHKEIIKYLKDFYNGKYTSQGFDSDVDEYIAIQCDLIDDEGVKHDLEDPYYIGDDVYCCGQHLKELKDDLYCEICGTTYEC